MRVRWPGLVAMFALWVFVAGCTAESGGTAETDASDPDAAGDGAVDASDPDADSDASEPDAGLDAAVDASGPHAGLDAAMDASEPDGGMDAAVDAEVDGAADASEPDAGMDAAVDAEVDGSSDASEPDAGMDAAVDAEVDGSSDASEPDTGMDAAVDAELDAETDAAPDAGPIAASSCMRCHNGAQDTEDYSGVGLEDPHPFGTAAGLACTTCHGGDATALDDKLASHVPPPPEVGSPVRDENFDPNRASGIWIDDPQAYFNRLTLVGVDRLPDYTIDGRTF